jgi:hypothetical protein
VGTIGRKADSPLEFGRTLPTCAYDAINGCLKSATWGHSLGHVAAETMAEWTPGQLQRYTGFHDREAGHVFFALELHLLLHSY